VAEKLAKRDARIILVARDKTRGDATLARHRNSAPGVAHPTSDVDDLQSAKNYGL
jgi:short-subunit dehydrogenase